MVSLLKRIFIRRVVIEFTPWEYFSEDGEVYFTGMVLSVNGKEIKWSEYNPESAVFDVLTELGYKVEIKTT